MDTNTVLKPEDFLPYYQMLEAAKAGPAALLLKTLTFIEADRAECKNLFVYVCSLQARQNCALKRYTIARVWLYYSFP